MTIDLESSCTLSELRSLHSMDKHKVNETDEKFEFLSKNSNLLAQSGHSCNVRVEIEKLFFLLEDCFEPCETGFEAQKTERIETSVCMCVYDSRSFESIFHTFSLIENFKISQFTKIVFNQFWIFIENNYFFLIIFGRFWSLEFYTNKSKTIRVTLASSSYQSIYKSSSTLEPIMGMSLKEQTHCQTLSNTQSIDRHFGREILKI